MIKLTRPLCCFDLEATGLETSKDRIVSIAISRLTPPDSAPDTNNNFYTLVNPGIPILKESTEIHGITDEMVKDAPLFIAIADKVQQFLKGCDLAGFNLRNFDIPMLYEELARCGIEMDTAVDVIDVGCIFKLKEKRTLEAALLFYCNHEFEGAHNALNDVNATIAVLEGQRNRYADLAEMDVQQLSVFSKMDDRLDLAGKVLRDKDGDACYGIRVKGVSNVKVKNDIGFAYWMLRNDFPNQTKAVLRRVLDEIDNQGQTAML